MPAQCLHFLDLGASSQIVSMYLCAHVGSGHVKFLQRSTRSVHTCKWKGLLGIAVYDSVPASFVVAKERILVTFHSIVWVPSGSVNMQGPVECGGQVHPHNPYGSLWGCKQG